MTGAGSKAFEPVAVSMKCSLLVLSRVALEELAYIVEEKQRVEAGREQEMLFRRAP